MFLKIDYNPVSMSLSG